MTYLEELHDAIKHLHGVESTHVESVPVKETFRGETVWEGIVEVFELHAGTGCTRILLRHRILVLRELQLRVCAPLPTKPLLIQGRVLFTQRRRETRHAWLAARARTLSIVCDLSGGVIEVAFSQRPEVAQGGCKSL